MTASVSPHPYRPSRTAVLARKTLLGNQEDLAKEPGLLPEAFRILAQPNPSPQDLRSVARLLRAAAVAADTWAHQGTAALVSLRAAS